MVETIANEVDHALAGELDEEEVERVIGDAKAAAEKLRAAGLAEEAALMDEMVWMFEAASGVGCWIHVGYSSQQRCSWMVKHMLVCMELRDAQSTVRIESSAAVGVHLMKLLPQCKIHVSQVGSN